MARIVFPVALAVLLLSEVQAVKAGEPSVRDDFLLLCADCHGTDATGGGPLAKNLAKIPPDLTRIKQRAKGEFNEKAVFDWILGLKMANFHGTREMPIWGDWLMDETLEGSTSLEAAPRAEKDVERRVMAIVKYLEGLQISQ